MSKLIEFAKDHYWGELTDHKDLIIKHLEGILTLIDIEQNTRVEQPKCERCGDRKVVRTPEMGGGDEPCPDCAEQPKHLNCPKCGKAFPLYMETEFNGHVKGCPAEQPKCKTCGGIGALLGKDPDPQFPMSCQGVPCPDCAEQPKAKEKP